MRSGYSQKTAQQTLEVGASTFQGGFDPRAGYRTLSPARRCVYNEAYARIGDAQFPGQRRLRHGCHPDDRAAITLHAVDLGGGLKPGTLYAPVYATSMQPARETAFVSGLDQSSADVVIERPREIDVPNLPDLDVGVRAPQA